MTLDEYLTKAKDERNLTETQFAELVGSSQSYINRLRRREALPSFALMRRIRLATANNVTAADFDAEPIEAA